MNFKTVKNISLSTDEIYLGKWDWAIADSRKSVTALTWGESLAEYCGIISEMLDNITDQWTATTPSSSAYNIHTPMSLYQPDQWLSSSVVVLEKSPWPWGSSRTNLQVLVLWSQVTVFVLKAQVLDLVLVLGPCPRTWSPWPMSLSSRILEDQLTSPCPWPLISSHCLCPRSSSPWSCPCPQTVS